MEPCSAGGRASVTGATRRGLARQVVPAPLLSIRQAPLGPPER